jgi:hypothetical protein
MLARIKKVQAALRLSEMQTSLRSLCYFLCVRQDKSKPKAFASLASTPLLVRSQSFVAQGFKRAVALWRLRGIGAKALSLDFIKSLVAPGKGGIEIPPYKRIFFSHFLYPYKKWAPHAQWN